MHLTRMLLICSAVVACEAPALACDTEASATPNSTCVVQARGDRRGVWFDLATANVLRVDHEQAPHLRAEVGYYGTLEAIRTEQIKALERANTERVAAAQAAETALKEAREAMASTDAWYRSPLTWGLVGVVLGGAATAFVAFEVAR